MTRKLKINTVFILKKSILKFRLIVIETSIKEFLLAPYYPSLKSVYDALKKWGIKHYLLKLVTVEIKELKLQFFAHLIVSGDHLAFIEEINGGEGSIDIMSYNLIL